MAKSNSILAGKSNVVGIVAMAALFFVALFMPPKWEIDAETGSQLMELFTGIVLAMILGQKAVDFATKGKTSGNPPPEPGAKPSVKEAAEILVAAANSEKG